ncbi:hypothetical protein FBEOM_2473 [Fusarium beomiforme]|uniref:Secreted protein n=1 Tax=Fusarium beomiforme TaxID=44412 RepID=A0A9P5ART7_9HYPO|nr:hypothetical protein FBEOM_2473 [Fusarium beomiforme]
MLASSTILLFSIWQAATAAGHVIQRDFDDSLLPSNDTDNSTEPIRGDYTWTPTCKLPSPKGFQSPMGFDFPKGCVSATGTVNAFMIFVDFPDAEDDRSPQAMHDSLVPEAVEWYAQASYNTLKLNVTADTSGYYRMPNAAASYGWMAGGFWQDNYLNDALDIFTANGTRSPPEADILYVVPTGRAADHIARSMARYDPISTRHGKKVTFKKAVTFGAADWDLVPMSVVHETGHAFCLSDYYGFDGYLGRYVGEFGVMAQHQGIAPDFFAWDKYRLGWMSDSAVDCVLEAGSTEHVLTPLAWNIPGKKAVVIAGSEIAALVAEVRIAAGVDMRACAPGVLLYTVETRENPGPIRIVDATPGSMGCPGHLDDLNDATLSLTKEGSESLAPAPVSSFDVPGWNLTVTLLSVKDQEYTIRVDRQTGARTDSW